jgi:hypothetical protein
VRECGPEAWPDTSDMRALLTELGLERDIVTAAALVTPGLVESCPAALLRILGLTTADRSCRLLGLRGGSEDLVAPLRDRLGQRLRCGRAVVALQHEGSIYRVVLAGEPVTLLEAERLVLAVPGPVATGLLRSLAPFGGPPYGPAAAGGLASAAFQPLATVHLGFQAGAMAEDRPWLAVAPRPDVVLGLDCSALWPRRAPPGCRLYRLLVGGGAAGAATPALLALAEAAGRELFWLAGNKLLLARAERHAFAPLPADSSPLPLEALSGVFLLGHSAGVPTLMAAARRSRSLAEQLLGHG